MVLEVFAICDAATDYGGRLNILGAFEGLAGPSLPVTRERCSLVMRMRFSEGQVGEREISVRIKDAEGGMTIPEMKARFNVRMPRGRSSSAVNLVLNINQLKFPRFGDYQISLYFDGQEWSSLPLAVVQARRPGGAAEGRAE